MHSNRLTQLKHRLVLASSISKASLAHGCSYSFAVIVQLVSTPSVPVAMECKPLAQSVMVCDCILPEKPRGAFSK